MKAGSGKKPVWATEFGWTVGRPRQTVTPAQQAEYTAAAFRKATLDWPWLQLLAVSNLGGAGDPNTMATACSKRTAGPRPIFTVLQKANGLLPPRLPRSSGSLTPDYRPVLAADVVIQLGGDRSTLDEVRREWQGTVYVPDRRARVDIDDAGCADRRFRSTMWINGTQLAPASPPSNSSGQWVTAAWTGSLVRLGPNEIRVSLDENQPSSALPVEDIVLTR